ncbi:hypothetical protein KCP76_13765 [Salmonella enterica subsp. enterica serovar Weltevreden]|nr:hypothetical protein KCP76_13765 [Salmonella enterica subsp. enterica serovar Weltevreden]
MTDSTRAGKPAHPAAGGGGAVQHLRHRAGALTLNYFGIISFTCRRRPSGLSGGADGPTAIPVGQAGYGTAGGDSGGGGTRIWRWCR